jgi:hypothetical protein
MLLPVVENGPDVVGFAHAINGRISSAEVPVRPPVREAGLREGVRQHGHNHRGRGRQSSSFSHRRSAARTTGCRRVVLP